MLPAVVTVVRLPRSKAVRVSHSAAVGMRKLFKCQDLGGEPESLCWL